MSASRLLSPAAVLCALAFAPSARAQVPDCDGHDTSGAVEHAAAGERFLRDASGHGSAADRRTAGEHALAEFDAQCAAGDDTALLGRALAYLSLGQRMESALSLDAFLERHPQSTLDATAQRRATGNLAAGSVAVVVEGDAAGARLFIDGFDFGALPRDRPVHLPYGEHAVEARRDASIVGHDRASLDSGSPTATITFTFAAAAPPPPPHVDAPPPETIDEPAPQRTDFTPWTILSGSVALAGAGVGIGFFVGADERARTYNSTTYGCSTGAPYDPIGCRSVLRERDTFQTIGIVGFVTAGVGLLAAGAFWLLDLAQPKHHTRVACLPTLGGLSCAGEF